MKPFLLAIVATFLVATSVSAQNFGYVRSDEVLAKMPELQTIDSELQGLQKVLQSKREAMIKTLQSEYQDLQYRQEQGTITPKNLEIEGAALKAKEDSIVVFEQRMVSDYQKKRDDLLQPVLDRVNQAIKDVAAEGKYQYIFEWGSGVLLYADEQKDVTKLVMTKLNISTN
jgi:outer membrane protein